MFALSDQCLLKQGPGFWNNTSIVSQPGFQGSSKESTVPSADSCSGSTHYFSRAGSLSTGADTLPCTVGATSFWHLVFPQDFVSWEQELYIYCTQENNWGQRTNLKNE